MVLATVPEAPPTTRNQRATSCPAPISAKEPNLDVSRFSDSALRCVSSFSVDGISRLRICPMQEICQFRRRATYWNDEANLCLVDVALPVFGHRCRHVDCANDSGTCARWLRDRVSPTRIAASKIRQIRPTYTYLCREGLNDEIGGRWHRNCPTRSLVRCHSEPQEDSSARTHRACKNSELRTQLHTGRATKAPLPLHCQ